MSPACASPALPRHSARGGLASFTIEGMHPHDIAELADRGGVCIRAGHHCAQPLMRCLGVERDGAREHRCLQRGPRTSTRSSTRCSSGARCSDC